MQIVKMRNKSNSEFHDLLIEYFFRIRIGQILAIFFPKKLLKKSIPSFELDILVWNVDALDNRIKSKSILLRIMSFKERLSGCIHIPRYFQRRLIEDDDESWFVPLFDPFDGPRSKHLGDPFIMFIRLNLWQHTKSRR